MDCNLIIAGVSVQVEINILHTFQELATKAIPLDVLYAVRFYARIGVHAKFPCYFRLDDLF